MTLWSVVDSHEAITVPVRRRLIRSIEVSRTVVTAAPSVRSVGAEPAACDGPQDEATVPAPIYPFHANDRRSGRCSLTLVTETFEMRATAVGRR
ncbi:hypothetical protein GCM10022419_021080 [Nonomuraea rosea]|uniref:Uncharacterized protein n=1 Tax=Nonomuraea rosea TaxID=638574 RepID=A0ABP6VTN2_9ACTN